MQHAGATVDRIVLRVKGYLCFVGEIRPVLGSRVSLPAGWDGLAQSAQLKLLKRDDASSSLLLSVTAPQVVVSTS